MITKESVTNIKGSIVKNQIFLTVAAILYLLPLLTNTTFSAERALLYTLTELFILGIFALSFEFQLGRAGLLNFGHAAFFGLGAYTMVFFLKPTIFPAPISDILALPSSILPYPLNSFIPLGLLLPILFSVIVGVLLGIVMGSTTNRMKGTAFAFIALALAMVIYEIFNLQSMQEISGGETGQSIGSNNPPVLFDWIFYFILAALAFIIIIVFVITIFFDIKERNHLFKIDLSQRKTAIDYLEEQEKNTRKTITGIVIALAVLVLIIVITLPNMLDMYFYGKAVHFQKPNYYYVVLTFSLLSYLFIKKVVNSPFGRVLAAIAQNEERVQAMGYNVFAYKITAVAISGGLAALAGALFVPYKITVDPVITLGVGQTIDAMLFTIIGGLGTILGSFIGAGIVRFSELRLTDVLEGFGFPGETWLVFLGIIYVFIVLFFPWGIVGSIKIRSRKIKPKLREWFGIRENDYWWLTGIIVILTIFLMLNLTEENIKSLLSIFFGS